MQGGESEGGSEGAAKVVGPGGHRLGNGKVEGSGDRQDGRDGTGTDTEVEE